MQTRWKRAAQVGAADQLVTGGENNPLRLTDSDTERRRAWDVCEVRVVPVMPRGADLVESIVAIADGHPVPTARRVEFRAVIRGGGKDGCDWWRTFTTDAKTKVRVVA